MRCRPARLRSAAASASSTPLVVSARSRSQGRAASCGDERRQVAAEQRLAAGEAEAVDARARANRSAQRPISSNVSTSSRGSQRYSSSGMQ